MLERLATDFPVFIGKVKKKRKTHPENILPAATQEEIQMLETSLGIPLPCSYKSFLKRSRGFWLFGGAVQFGSQHPFFHHFPKLEELTPAQRRMIELKGGKWPPPSEGMLCFAEYFRDADGDQVLFDVSGGLINGEYPVMYYSHETRPPFVVKVANSFQEWLDAKCIDEMA